MFIKCKLCGELVAKQEIVIVEVGLRHELFVELCGNCVNDVKKA